MLISMPISARVDSDNCMSKDISVIIPCFNDGQYVEAAVRSVLDQTLADRVLEVVISDDGSEDETLRIVEQLPKMDDKVRFLHQNNSGVAAARNVAIKQTSGAFVAFLDADDLWESRKLELQMPLFNGDQKVGLTYTDLFLVEPNDIEERRLVRCTSFQPDSKDVLVRYYVDDAPIIPSTMIIRRAVFEKVGEFDPTFIYGEDTEMCLRILAHFSVAHLPAATVLKRQRLISLGADREANQPSTRHLTQLAAKRYPVLRPFQKVRLARRLAKLGQYQESKGDQNAARMTYFDVLRHDPKFARGYFLYAASWLPGRWSFAIQRTLKKLRHR